VRRAKIEHLSRIEKKNEYRQGGCVKGKINFCTKEL